jgi:hypothetical protein
MAYGKTANQLHIKKKKKKKKKKKNTAVIRNGQLLQTCLLITKIKKS